VISSGSTNSAHARAGATYASVDDDEWARAWRPMIDAVGTEFGEGRVLAAPDAVEPGAVRKFVEPLEFGCPLHHDGVAARQHGYRGVVVPVSSTVTFTIQPIWRPGEPSVFTASGRDAQPTRTPTGPRLTGLEPPTTSHFAADLSADYVTPVVIGDRLYRSGNLLLSVVPKRTRIGRGAFTTWQSEIRNQRDELVARLRNTAYSYVPYDTASSATPRPAGEQPPRPAEPEAVPDSIVDWTQPRWWEDLFVGAGLPALRFPLSVYRLVMAAGSNRDFNPIHHNSAWALSTGAPEMYANVVFLQGTWERCVREYIGMAGTIRQLSGFRMGSFNTVGDTVTVGGSVARVWRDGDVGLAELRMWSRNRHGVSVGPGTVTVTLPLREAAR
jgi:acyl dehydratase